MTSSQNWLEAVTNKLGAPFFVQELAALSEQLGSLPKAPRIRILCGLGMARQVISHKVEMICGQDSHHLITNGKVDEAIGYALLEATPTRQFYRLTVIRDAFLRQGSSANESLATHAKKVANAMRDVIRLIEEPIEHINALITLGQCLADFRMLTEALQILKEAFDRILSNFDQTQQSQNLFKVFSVVAENKIDEQVKSWCDSLADESLRSECSWQLARSLASLGPSYLERAKGMAAI